MVALAGRRAVLLNPRTYICAYKDAPKLIGLDKPLGWDWTETDENWILIPYTVNGLQVTYNNPKQDLVSDEVGVVETLPSGGDSVNIQTQPLTPSMEVVKFISGMAKAIAAATVSMPMAESYYLDPDEDNSFVLGFEGRARAGSLFPEERIVRFFGYCCEQTDNPQLAARSRGTDGRLSPTVNVRCLPGEVTDAQLAGTGITRDTVDQSGNLVKGLLDPTGKSNWFMIDPESTL